MVREYTFLAVSCVAVGMVLIIITLGVSVRLGIDINKNFWVVAIPVVLSLALNIALLEVYHKYKKRK